MTKDIKRKYISKLLYTHRPATPAQPTHGEKSVSLTRVPGTPLHHQSRPTRPRTAPGPFNSASKPAQPPSAKSSITSVVASESVQQKTEDGSPAVEPTNTAETIPPKRGATSASVNEVDHGKSSTTSKAQQRKLSESELHL